MFGLFEQSRTLGQPVALFDIRIDASVNGTLRYTNGEDTVRFGGHDFVHAEIQVDDSIVSSGTLDKKQIKFRMPRTTPLTELFRSYPPDKPVILTIYQGHADDPDRDFKSTWRGRILGFHLEGSEAVFECEPAGTSMRRPGLRRCYTYGCPHVLFGPGCHANKAAATVVAKIAAVEGSIITLPPGWFGEADPKKWVNGTLEWTRDGTVAVARTILQVNNGSGDHQDLLLSGPARSLKPGLSVKVVKGCNHQMSDCNDVHNNIQNFGGFPWIPTSNPVGTVNRFY